jgi:predicted thioesterase
MSKPVPVGTTAEFEETVALGHTLTAHHKDLPPVYSTPDMIRLMETAGFFALLPFCEEGEISVGTAIEVEHRAASGIGARIRATATLESFDGRFYWMRVTAHDGDVEIGRGRIGRAFVKISDFLAKSGIQSLENTPHAKH